MKTKNIRKVLVVVLVLGLLAGAGGYAGYRGYLAHRESRLIEQAQNHLAKSNTRKAQLCLQRVLKNNPRNVEACRLMAAMSDLSDSREAFLWRSRAVEINPRSLADRLALAQSAMMLKDFAAATNALEAVEATGKKTAGYHNLAGQLSSMVGQLSPAEAHFLEAARLEPTNQIPQFNLAVVHLYSTNSSAVAEARATLTRISSSNPALRCQALRELLVDSLRARQTNAALALSQELALQTNGTFGDQLLRLDVLRGSQNDGFKRALEATQHEVGTNLLKISELGEWQMARTGPADTLTWLRRLPLSTQTNQVVEMLTADCLTMLGDWRGLQNAVTKQNWGGYDFLRHAFLTRALREQGFAGAATAEWEAALQMVSRSEFKKGNLDMLLRMAAAWKWQNEGEKLLWAIVKEFPDDKGAVQSLIQILYAGGRTRPLMQLFMQESKRAPSELDIKNNLTMIALLLDAKELKPHDLARGTYEAAPSNAAYASTYAFSLYLQGKIAEALKIYQTLNPKDLEQPSNAGYYGLILKASGNKEKARTYLNWAFKGPMLPEERKIFEQAKAGV